MADQQLIAQLGGASLITAEILYRMPDHPGLLQSFLWQDYDTAPNFPRLGAFLLFWNSNIDGPLYRVKVMSKKLVSPAEFHFVDGQLTLH
jgi:uncharacterized protein Usg